MLFVPYPLFYTCNYLFLWHGLREDFLEGEKLKKKDEILCHYLEGP